MKKKTDNEIKIKEIYLPFLLISIITILSYSLFRWIIDVRFDIIQVKDDLLNFWIPFVLPMIPISIWLRPRIKILNVKGSRDNGHSGYQFAMSFAITIPIIISQIYIEKAPFELIELSSIDKVRNYENEKYFKIDSFSIDQKSTLTYVTSRISGRYNDVLTFYSYFSCPFNNSNDIWYGVEFDKRLNNNTNGNQKNDEYRNFLAHSNENFKKFNFYYINYFEKLNYTDERDGFIEAIKQANPQINENNQIILIPKNDNFSERLGNTFHWIYGSFIIGSIVIFIMIIIPTINSQELYNFENGKTPREEGLSFILSYINPNGEYKITAILLLLNITAFIIMAFSGVNIASPSPKELLDFGGNSRTEVMDGQYWRLLTSIFVHGGIMHLIMNLFGLAVAASFLEKTLGKFWLLIGFIACGIFASIVSIYWHENNVSVGASGAIFGLYGLIFSFTVFKIYPSDMHGIAWIILMLFAGLGLLFGLLGSIDNAAHLGGLLSGFLLGIILVITRKKTMIKNSTSL